MIVECYSADVYCDMPDHPYVHYEPVDQFTGPNKRSCDRQRRKAGWVKIKGEDCCPDCKAKLRQAKKPKHDLPPIPSGVYYSLEHDNFYKLPNFTGMGNAFHKRWRIRWQEFPHEPPEEKP